MKLNVFEDIVSGGYNSPPRKIPKVKCPNCDINQAQKRWRKITDPKIADGKVAQGSIFYTLTPKGIKGSVCKNCGQIFFVPLYELVEIKDKVTEETKPLYCLKQIYAVMTPATQLKIALMRNIEGESLHDHQPWDKKKYALRTLKVSEILKQCDIDVDEISITPGNSVRDKEVNHYIDSLIGLRIVAGRKIKEGAAVLPIFICPHAGRPKNNVSGIYPPVPFLVAEGLHRLLACHDLGIETIKAHVCADSNDAPCDLYEKFKDVIRPVNKKEDRSVREY